MKQPRYFLVPCEITPAISPKVALECLVRRSGDTYGVAKILHAGAIEVWRHGKKLGRFDSFNAVFNALDKAQKNDGA